MRCKSKKRIYIRSFSFHKSRAERMLISLSVAVFFVLIAAQIALVLPESRSELTDIEVYEGIDMAGKLPEATVVFEADSLVSSDAKVLFNGKPCATFSDGTCSVSLINRGLIEIDGRACAKDFSVKVSAVDGTVSGLEKEDTFLIGQGMTVIGRVEVLNISD